MFIEALITFLIVLVFLIVLFGAILSPLIHDVIIDYLNKKNRK